MFSEDLNCLVVRSPRREDSQYASRFGDRRFASPELFSPKSFLEEALDVANA